MNVTVNAALYGALGLAAAAGVGALAGAGAGPEVLALFGVAAALALVAISNRALSLPEYLVAISVCGFVILNRGWSYVGASAGGLPVFIGEVTLVCGILAAAGRLNDRPQPYRPTAAMWLVPFFAVGFVHVLGDVRAAGLEAVRNFSLVYYVVFVPIGYFAALRASRRLRLFQVLGVGLVLQVFYSALYPWRLSVVEASPRSPEGVPYFGNHASCYVFVILAVAFLYLLGRPVLRLGRAAVGALSVFGVLVLLAIQSRAGMLGAMVALAAVVFLGRHRLGRALTGMILVAAGVLSVLSLLGAPVRGERGAVSLDNVVLIAQTIFFRGEPSDVEDLDVDEDDFDAARGMMGTREWRMSMWKRVVADTMATTRGTLLGRGFQEVFVPDKSQGQYTIRHPHNVFVSVFGRTGLLGLLCFALFYLTLAYQLVGAVRRRPPAADPTRDTLLFFAVFALIVPVAALTSPLHDSPHFGVPLHFLGGVACALLDLERRGELIYCFREPSRDATILEAADQHVGLRAEPAPGVFEDGAAPAQKPPVPQPSRGPGGGGLPEGA